MNSNKYVGLDIHLATISCAVLDSDGNQLMSLVLQTKAELIVGFLQGLKGEVHLAFEEGTWSQWMFEITKPLVERVVVCNPRLLSGKGKKNDKLDATKLADLLRLNALRGVYHHQRRSFSEIKQLVVIYNQLTEDRTRSINRLRSVFREQAMTIKLDGVALAESVKELPTAGHRERAELLFAEIEAITQLREKARQKMIAQAEEQKSYHLLQSLPGISSIRAAQLLAWVITPHRFRSKRQFWSYCGLSVITRSSADYRVVGGKIVKSQNDGTTYGLTTEYHRGLKNLFKGAALDSIKNEKMRGSYQKLVDRGLKETIARVQMARKIAASCLAIWKSGKKFEIERFSS